MSVLAAALVGLPAAAPAASPSFRLSDQESEVYYHQALAAGSEIQLAGGVTITGDVVSNGGIHLERDSRIDGAASAAGRIDGQGTVTGEVQEGSAPVPLPALLSAGELRALADRTFDGSQTFDQLTLDGIVFVDGEVRVRGDLGGEGTLIATRDIRLDGAGEGSEAAAPQGAFTLDPATRVSLISLEDIRLGKGRALRGVLRAARDVELDKEIAFEGVIVAGRKVQIDKDSTATFIDFDPVAPQVLLVTPQDGAFVGTATPTISLRYTDDFSGLREGSLQLLLDGVDRTAEAERSGASPDLTLTLIPSAPLAEGAHAVEGAAVDHSDNPGHGSFSFVVDSVPPTLAVTAPADPVIYNDVPPVVVEFSDATSGVEPATLRVSIDGAEITESCVLGEASAICPAPAGLADGDHTVDAEIADRAGHRATASLSFRLIIDHEPPTVSLVAPAEPRIVNVARPHVQATFRDDGSGVDPASVRFLLDGVDRTGEATVTEAGLDFTPGVDLGPDDHSVAISLQDVAGNPATETWEITLDTEAPALAIDTPADGQIFNGSSARVAGTATDDNGVATVEVNGAPAVLAGDRFDADVPIAEGDNPIVVRATDVAGNVVEAAVTAVGFSLPEVEITGPPTLAYLAATAIDVTGTVSPSDATVSVNGIAAEVVSGTFLAHDVPLVEGGNVLTATATDPRGHESTDSVNVVRDLTAPHVQVYLPADGATVFEDAVAVAGLVNDIVPGTVNAGQVTVSVNGLPAEVSNRSFLVPDLPLVEGDNEIVVTATDVGGNTGQARVTVHRAPANIPRIAIVSGDRQTGRIGTLLPEPLTVALLGSDGAPVAGRPVRFRLQRSSGSLDGGRRQVAVVTGPDGRASVHFTLGSRAGVGAQTVEVESAGFAGPAVFSATALPGDPALIVVDSGGDQIGLAGRPLPRPLIGAVTDSGFNRLAGVPVRFSVVKGAGLLDGGESEEVVTTDSDGRAIVRFTLGPEEGVSNNVVEARVDGLAGSPLASWTASGMTAGDPALTSIRGVVLDNTNLPVPGATVRIRDTSILTQTDARGYFRIQPAPVGTLYLIVDGSTVTRPGSWPDLESVVTTIPGREKTLPMPVFLLPIDLPHGIFVSETQGGTLTLPGVPGFALDVQPGSVTFPSGSKSGVVSVTMVHSDRVPMTPNFGQQPRLIVTIQPAGARFDPPARLTLPNVEGLAPGEVTDLYSFDHDLGHFVSIGPGTVSEDGALIVSNPGVGIVKAGWHCGGNPASSGTAHDCPDCYTCVSNRCEPTSGGSCDDHDVCTVNDSCQNGTCTGDRRRIVSVDAKGDGMDSVETHRNKDVSFTAEAEQEHCDSLTYDWDFGDGATGSGQSVTHAYSEAGTFTARVTVTCEPCSSETKTDSVMVEVKKFQVKIEEPMKGKHFDMQADPPKMPDVKAKAKIVGLDPDPTNQTDFSWTVMLKLERSKCPHGVGADIVHPDVQDTVTGPDYQPKFDQLISGDLKFKVEATIDGDTDDDQRDGVDVRGTNPPNASVRARMPHDTLGRIACQESRFRQYNAAAGGGMNKCPLFSSDNLGGVGIMQITRPAPTRDETFDWRANVDRGIAIFNQKVAGARGYPAQLQGSSGFQNLVNLFNQARQAQNLPPVRVTVPAFTSGDFNTNLMELERDSIRGYNGWGGPRFLGFVLHQYRLQLDQNGMLVVMVDEQAGTGEAQWEEVPVADRGTFGEPNYVNLVLGRSPTCQ